jgi:hypothetical protein
MATEQSPLLKSGAANGHREAYVSVDEVSPEGSLRNGVNGSVAKIRTQDEESRGSGEVEEPVRSANVVGIISVLLIGASLSSDLRMPGVWTANS